MFKVGYSLEVIRVSLESPISLFGLRSHEHTGDYEDAIGIAGVYPIFAGEDSEMKFNPVWPAIFVVLEFLPILNS